MKAAICTKYGPPDVLKVMEVEKPAPGANEVLVKVHASAVTASDCIVRGFKIPRWRPMGLMMGLALGFRKPRRSILGLIVAGDVEKAGSMYKGFEKGSRVYAVTMLHFGGYAEYACLPGYSTIAAIPSNLSYVEAAALPYGGLMALYYLKKSKIGSGSNVLIYGASGAIGTSAVQLAKYFGANVTGVCSTGNLGWVKDLGADNVIDYTKVDIRDITEKFDLILDAVGKKKGSDFKSKLKRLLTGKGIYLSVDDGSPKMRSEDLAFLTRLAEAGKLKPVIDKVYPLDQIVAAHEYVDNGHKKGNVVIDMNTHK
jgi:NADPH:quinone reductase-like Zn-dependent oxidoreductase